MCWTKDCGITGADWRSRWGWLEASLLSWWPGLVALDLVRTIQPFVVERQIATYCLPIDGANWCCTESVGWMLQFRWTTSGCGRPTKWTRNQKGGRSEPAKHPPMAKLVSQGWSSNFLGVKCQRKCTYPRFVQTGPFYRDLVVVISSVTSPRFMEANEYEHNFLNGYRSCNR